MTAPRPFAALACICAAAALAGCTAQPEVTRLDLTERQGLYIVGYTANHVRRAQFEDQLAAELADEGFTVFTSHGDIAYITKSTPATVVANANAHRALAVLVVAPVASDGSGGPVNDPDKLSMQHKDLSGFYADSKKRTSQYDPNSEVFLEVNAFVLDGDDPNPRLFWSGSSWTFVADGSGAGMDSVTELLTQALVSLRESVGTNAFGSMVPP